MQKNNNLFYSFFILFINYCSEFPTQPSVVGFCRIVFIDNWNKMVYYIHILNKIFQKDKD